MARVLVLGSGRSGRAAAALLTAQGHEAVVLADQARDRIEGSFAFAVTSPGIALAHPWLREAFRRGIPVRSELQLGCETLVRRGWKLLAVTGSKGKSSVVKVVADAIRLAGVRAEPCGNYGVPVSEIALSQPVGWAVVEVSSFMMETTALPPDTFEAAAVLNLQEDHLDRHGSVEVYHGLKRQLLTMAKKAMDNSGLSSRTRSGDDPFSAERVPFADSYFDNEILRANAVSAAWLMAVAGVPRPLIVRAFREFVPLAHRMNFVAEIAGVRYVDDSKATSLAALVAGVRMSPPPVRLIAGGLPKGDDPETAIPVLTERVKKVYTIGQCAEVFLKAWKSVVECEVCGTMEKAVESARREAEKGDTVLLSPGTASFDQFRSFEERGDVFARLVKDKG